MVKHQIYEVVAAGESFAWGTRYFSVYWTHSRNGLRYVFPNIMARDEIEAYFIALKKLEQGAEQ